MRTLFLFAAALSFALAAPPAPSQAQPPDRLDTYRILPRWSVLGESGGIAGSARRYRLTGGYDLLQMFETTPFGGFVQTAEFDNAEVWGSQILPPGVVAPAIVLDVDELLNLEDLRGSALPLGAPFDAYHFQGVMDDGSDVDLFAALLGRWMYVVGETTPPPGSADFFEYKVRILARTGSWADANEDGVVDAADYTAVRDAATSGLVDIDLDDWVAQFGESVPDMDALDAAFAFATATATPEPGAIALVALAVTLGLGTRRSACRP